MPASHRGERPYRGRFAPSPTGWLHLGNARTALVAWLRARAAGGAFVLRVEDLDGPRTRPEALEGNLAELRWLGLDWDEGPDVGGPHAPYRQSERSHLYLAALHRLDAQGLTFDCFLSRKELAELASAPHGPAGAGEGVYGEAERRSSAAQADAKRAEGRRPSVRFEVPDRPVAFDDLFAGPQLLGAREDVGHVVIRRSDGLWAYQLAVVVDDFEMGITEVVRGADLLRSTAAQLLLYEALGWQPPRFAHLGLVADEAGERLAKRRGSLTLKELSEAGVRAERVVGLLAHGLGLVPEPTELSAQELLSSFDLQRTSFPAAHIASEELAWLGVAGG